MSNIRNCDVCGQYRHKENYKVYSLDKKLGTVSSADTDIVHLNEVEEWRPGVACICLPCLEQLNRPVIDSMRPREVKPA